MSAPAPAGVVGSCTFHEVLLRWGPAYLDRHASAMPARQSQILRKILACRTAQQGGSLYRCAPCEKWHYAYHSCNDRHCPQCGQSDTENWLKQHTHFLLPVTYFMVTFTLPAELRPWVRSHPKLAYQLLFQTTAWALQDLAANPKRLGAELGLLAILHTWSRTLIFHPHIHYLVPGGGLSLDQRQWLSKGAKFFLAKGPLANHFRTLFKRALAREAPEVLETLPATFWRRRWVIKVIAVGSGHEALRYLGRYVFKTATGNRRLLELDNGLVRWPYRDSRTRKWTHIDLEPEELIRRFLQHVLPSHFHRVRLLGWLHPGGRTKLNRVRALLGQPPHPTTAEQTAWKLPEELLEPPHELETLPPPSLAPLCPHCRQPMILRARWNAGQIPPLLPRPP